MLDAGPRETLTDAFLGGRLTLTQPARGHRLGTDAALLAAAAPAAFTGLGLDAGAGAGGAGLALALTRPGAEVGLIENDPFMAGLARVNIAQNGLNRRCFVAEADLLSPSSRAAAGLGSETAQLVLTNPPYLDPSSARLSPDPQRRRAHAMSAEVPGGLAAWIEACFALLAPRGVLIMIHRPEALSHLLQSMGARSGAITVLPIYPREKSEAVRILVRAKKGSRAPLSIAAPLVLHSGGGFTPLADALHRGAAVIDW